MNKQAFVRIISLSVLALFCTNQIVPQNAIAQDASAIDETSFNDSLKKKEVTRKKAGELRINGIGDDVKQKAEDLSIIEPKPEDILPPPPPKPLTNAEIAKEIAPFFDVEKDYNRLVQCYGTADFLGALTKIRASSPGANPALKGIAGYIAAMKPQMQPFVLASSRVKTEPKFRKDYDLVARKVEKSVFAQADFNKALNPHLKTLDGCSKDINKWRGGK